MMKTLAIAVLAVGLCLAVAGTGAALTGARQGCIFLARPAAVGHNLGLIVFVQGSNGDGSPWDFANFIGATLERFGTPVLVSEQTFVWYNTSGAGMSPKLRLKDNPKATFYARHPAGVPAACAATWEIRL